MMSIIKLIKNLLVWILILLSLISIICIFSIIYYSYPKKTHKADAIIVLGAAVWGNKPSPIYENRLINAINLLKEEKANYIIFTGGSPSKNYPTEGYIGKKWAIKNGVAKEKIIVENSSRNTFDNLANTIKIIKKNKYNINDFIIVSDGYHLARAKLIAFNLNIKNQVFPSMHYKNKSFEKKMRFLLMELIKIEYYLLKIIQNKITSIFKC